MKLSDAFEKHKITDLKLKTILSYMGYLLDIDNMTDMS